MRDRSTKYVLRVSFLLVAGLASAVSCSRGQDFSLRNVSVAGLEPSESILGNSVSNIFTLGDSVWVGPFLNLTTDGGATWQVSDADSLFGTANRMFSIDIVGSTIWVGLGFTDFANGGIQSAGGFLVSTDGGESFSYRRPQLDAPGDTTVQYGVSTLRALDVIVPQQSPPFDINYDPVRDEVWVAGWASGIRKSSDGGLNWQRVVLPPDDLEEIHPDSTYDFSLEPRRGNLGSFNHLGFAVLVDDSGTVWAGTPAGVNRSLDGGNSWHRFSADGSANTLGANWVVSIEEQSLPEGNAIWLATWVSSETGDAGAKNGVAVTRDGGETFEQVLTGERFLDFAFSGRRIYVAGRESGLFVSDDDGRTWRTIRDFTPVDGQQRRIKIGADVISVATTDGAVWVGTSDGLLRSTDGASTWQTFRVEIPLNPAAPTEEVPRTDTFAYPNPFSPAADRFVRIRYENSAGGTADVRIFDFGMNLLRRISAETLRSGVQEATWDGTDDNGVRIANGTYFYSVDTGSDVVWGKILLIE